MRVLVTGGCGFIGSAVVRHLIRRGDEVVNLDKLTYSATLESVAEAEPSGRYRLVRADVADAPAVRSAFDVHRPDRIIHLAAETHVDRAIDAPGEFVRTNVLGTYTLLEEARRYAGHLDASEREAFRVLVVSTDEVFGSLGDSGAFSEESPYRPNSPYAASKAGADHLARAWHRTFGMPVIVTNCSNNYGPFQFPEKLIPRMILSALAGRDLPVYGNGANVRDWLFVDDHAAALLTILRRGVPGETYCISGSDEVSNLDMVRRLCALLDELAPRPDRRSYSERIAFVDDRPGHDFRYAIDDTKLRSMLGWKPAEQLDSGLRKTVQWYLGNRAWWEALTDRYQGERLGLAKKQVNAG